MGGLSHDVRFALRTFRRAPVFALIAIVTMALGIGANTAIFSVVDSLLLRPLPYPGADRLVFIETQSKSGSGRVSLPDFDDWRAQNQTFAGIAGYRGDTLTITGGPTPLILDAFAVTANIFEVLGVQPVLGRGFTAEEAQAGKNRVLVLTHPAWKR